MMLRETKPEHYRRCECGALVSVWCNPRHISLSHRRPLCAAYTEVDVDTIAPYLDNHTTASSGPDAEP